MAVFAFIPFLGGYEIVLLRSALWTDKSIGPPDGNKVIITVFFRGKMLLKIKHGYDGFHDKLRDSCYN
jgi:hypothetical protein